jgi:hypothetical protein
VTIVSVKLGHLQSSCQNDERCFETAATLDDTADWAVRMVLSARP